MKYLALAAMASAVLALAGCGGSSMQMSPEDPTPPEDPVESLEERQTMQRAAIEEAIGKTQTAVTAVDDDSTAAEVSAAEMAVMAARSAISAAADVPTAEKVANTARLDVLADWLATAKTSRTAAMDDARKAAEAMRVAEAMKLHAGIDLEPSSNDGVVSVSIGEDGSVSIPQTGGGGTDSLPEDEETMVPDNRGWKGKRYVDSRGTVEAYFYSSVGEAMEGAKFNVQYTDLNAATGERPVDTSTAAVQMLVASSSFDQRAETKEFELGTNLQRVVIPGSFHGVSGTYYCTPTGGGTDCAATVTADGFTLGGGTWTFKPGNPEARVTATPTNFIHYGWWLRKPDAGDEDYVASAGASYDGTATLSGITALRGTATYNGSAAGLYALSSATGGTNDSGPFTARAVLEADFHDDTVTGTIDGFTGADGEPRDWSVELMEQSVSDAGEISDADPDAPPGPDNVRQMTKWTIGGNAVEAGGEWSGQFHANDDGGVPMVVRGFFSSVYGPGGRMVGAFGAKRE